MLAPSRRHQSSSLLRREAEGVRGIHIRGPAIYAPWSPAACVSGCPGRRLGVRLAEDCT